MASPATNREKSRFAKERTPTRISAWKRHRDLPAFLDASASVAASTYGARRLPEIKALFNAHAANVASSGKSSARIIPSPESLQSSGCKTSSRHLRRRITSHNSRKRHRYPTGDNKSQEEDDDQVNIKQPSRRTRRKKAESLALPHHSWWKRQPESTNVAEADCMSVDPSMTHQSTANNTMESTTEALSKNKQEVVQWMTTHIWHAKRFHMADLWGWQVPMVHTNRGPKAALRLIREGKTLVQDITWRMAQPHVLTFTIPGAQSNDTMFVVEQMHSCIRRLCPEFQIIQSVATKPASSTIQSGHGMLYSLDRFPRGPLGPVSWLIVKDLPLIMMTGTEDRRGAASAGGNCSCYFVYFWSHPAILSATREEFQSLVESSKTTKNEPFSLALQGSTSAPANGVGMACLQLRGIHATQTIKSMIHCGNTAATIRSSNVVDATASSHATSSRLLADDQLHQKIPSGTAFPVLLKDDKIGTTEHVKQENCLEDSPWIRGHQALLLSRTHGVSAKLPQNAAAVGWDLYCDASIAKDLFLSLVLVGEACPIGIAEGSYINLECQPPIANLFPRDFPETDEGRKFWQVKPDADKSTSDLSILRLCLEEGESGGRISVPTIIKRCRASSSMSPKQQRNMKISPVRLASINWNDIFRGKANATLQDESADDSQPEDYEETVVMMRGLFGKPLIDALFGSGNIPKQLVGNPAEKHGSNSYKRAKLRRRVKQPNEIRHAIPLSRTEKESHLTTCNNLLQSLSLPAVIACHLQVVGAGTLQPGAQIYAVDDIGEGTNILGCVTTAAFSMGRGVFHGTGIVGASHLLRAIIAASSSRHPHKSFAVVADQGTKQIHLIAFVKNGDKIAKVTVGLLP